MVEADGGDDREEFVLGDVCCIILPPKPRFQHDQIAMLEKQQRQQRRVLEITQRFAHLPSQQFIEPPVRLFQRFVGDLLPVDPDPFVEAQDMGRRVVPDGEWRVTPPFAIFHLPSSIFHSG